MNYNYKCPKCGTRPATVYTDARGNVTFYCGDTKCNVDRVEIIFME